MQNPGDIVAASHGETLPPIETVPGRWEGRDIGLLSRTESPSSKIEIWLPLRALKKKTGLS